MSGVSLPEYKFVVRWTVQDVVNWLQESGFVDCSKIFRDAGIDGNKFVNLTESELSRINCPQKFRKEILYQIDSIPDKPERDKFSKPFSTDKTERDKFSRPSPAKQTPTRTPAPPPVQALPPNRPPVALPPQGNKYPKQSDVDDDDGWGSEEFDSGSESEEPFEIGGQVMKNEENEYTTIEAVEDEASPFQSPIRPKGPSAYDDVEILCTKGSSNFKLTAKTRTNGAKLPIPHISSLHRFTGGDSDYESPDEKNIPARSQARPGQQPKISAPGPRRVAPPPPTEDEFYEDPDAPKATLFHGGPLPPIPAVPKTVSDFPPVPKSPIVPSHSRPKIPDVAETEETYEDPDAKPTHTKGPLQRPPQNKPQTFEGPNVPTPIPQKISAPPPVSQIRTPQAAGKRPPPTPQEPEVYEDPNVQTSIAPKNSAPPPVSQIRTPQLPARRPPPTPQEPEVYEDPNVQTSITPKNSAPPPVSQIRTPQLPARRPPPTPQEPEIDDEYMEMEEKTQPSQSAHDIEESDADYLDPDPKLKVDPKTKKPAMVQVLPKLEPPKPPETKLQPRKQLPPPPTDSEPNQTVPASSVPRVAHVHSQPVTSSQSSGSANEEEEVLKTKPWYHGASTRQEVEPKLIQLKTNGMYCVRQSSGKPNQPYTLVVFCEDRIFNLPIRLRNDRKYALGGEKTDEVPFGSIVELVRFFRRNYLILNGMKGQQTQLKKPLPK